MGHARSRENKSSERVSERYTGTVTEVMSLLSTCFMSSWFFHIKRIGARGTESSSVSARAPFDHEAPSRERPRSVNLQFALEIIIINA